MKVLESGFPSALLALSRVPAQARFLCALTVALAWMGLSLATAHASPTLALNLNQTTFRPGDTLRVGLSARNPGPAFNADFYFGVVVPDGATVVFLTSLSPFNGAGTRLDADPRTFRPLLTDIRIVQDLNVTLTDVLVFAFSQGLPPGTYILFVALTLPRAFSDGRIDIGDVLALDAQALSFSLATPVGPSFPIAATPGGEGPISAAFDGTNYLVGIQGDAVAGSNITAQLVSPSGTLVGPRISVGHTGGAPQVGFDGTNYLMAWSDDANHPNDDIYGQVISPSGAKVGSPFPISQAPGRQEMQPSGVAFGGTNSLVVWEDFRSGTDRAAIFGQFVSRSGALMGAGDSDQHTKRGPTIPSRRL